MALPIKDGVITTPFGKKGTHWSGGMHTGVDFAVPVNTPVYAVADGKVANANWGKAYGVQIVQDLGGSLYCIYAHLTKSNVQPGAAIKKGDLIGYTGNTGNSTGAHLHFETRSGNIRWSLSKPVDPKDILNA